VRIAASQATPRRAVVNLEEARSVAKWLSEDVDYMDTTRDFPAFDPEKEHQEVVAAIILELVNGVERLQFREERLLDMVKDLEFLVATPREEEA
jgi:hypothetical protein